MKYKNFKKQGGFIEIIFVLIIVLVILSLFGITPGHVWSEWLLPILEVLWKYLSIVVGFFLNLIKEILSKF
jgi:hypothetical protein